MTDDRRYALAREEYAGYGVDADAAVAALAGIPVSLHCWQGDDVQGFECTGAPLGGGLAVTGSYPGKARTADELRADAERALALVPGPHRFSLHASYLEAGRPVDRDEVRPEHFAAGPTGRASGTSASTSTRPSSPTRWPPTATRSPTRTPGCGSSG